jgi:anti-sigma regulatory factor (Ser/Thr protein kinase)
VIVETFEKQLPAVDASSAEARAFLGMALSLWHLDRLGDVPQLLVTELVTNVVRHVGSSMTLRACFDRRTLRIEVDDPSDALPVMQYSQPEDESGRGLEIVDALASRWGVARQLDDGKSVWFELDLVA